MAVEATTQAHLNPFTPHQMMIQQQHRNNNMMMMMSQQQMVFPDIPLPAPGNITNYEAKTENSGLTYSTNYTPAPRKRPLDQLYHHHQLDIESIIYQHTKRIRMELEEKQKQETRVLLGAIGEGAMRRLKEKEGEIERIRKMNAFLEEKMKGLYAEAQSWRDLAQTNEATANTLRVSLQQALAAARVEDDDDDVESCCSSTGEEENSSSCLSRNKWGCRVCGERESRVLMLPCRHLCLCEVCGSGSHQIQACPVCNATTKATLHLNVSMS